jgi:hypothetical protein
LEVTMKMVKNLLLGTAAGLVAVAGAEAADLPVKAKPVEYVKICSVYGEGFLLHPGDRHLHQVRRLRPPELQLRASQRQLLGA